MIQMLKLLLTMLTLITPGSGSAAESSTASGEGSYGTEIVFQGLVPYKDASLLFDRLGLQEEELGFDAFELAYTGYMAIEDRSKDILTLIDYSKSSAVERMFVIDMAAEEVLFKTHVAHGKNSGTEYATSFSNVNNSYKSSPGFFLTENTYYGKAGYSLRLEDLEKGINDKAKTRAIVIHGSRYADPSVAAKKGMLGRSLGCPAIPPKVTKAIIDTIKDGSVLFIYPGNETYASLSPLLASNNHS